MRMEDSLHEEGIGGVDCAAEAEGGVDPDRERRLGCGDGRERGRRRSTLCQHCFRDLISWLTQLSR